MSDRLVRHAPAGLNLPEGLLATIREAYERRALPYHNLRHIEDVISHVDEVGRAVGWQQPHEVYLAALFHDAVYRPGAKTNEAESAELAVQTIRRHAPDSHLDLERVRRLILLTASHGKLTRQDVDPDSASSSRTTFTSAWMPPPAATSARHYASSPARTATGGCTNGY